MTYRFLSPAVWEVTEAAEYYDSQVSGLGADFLEELDAAIARILQFPEAWSTISKPFRHCQLRRFPYSIIYTLPTPHEVLIVVSALAARNAGPSDSAGGCVFASSASVLVVIRLLNLLAGGVGVEES